MALAVADVKSRGEQGIGRKVHMRVAERRQQGTAFQVFQRRSAESVWQFMDQEYNFPLIFNPKLVMVFSASQVMKDPA
jgi:hypothetical protein